MLRMKDHCRSRHSSFDTECRLLQALAIVERYMIEHAYHMHVIKLHPLSNEFSLDTTLRALTNQLM